MAYLIKGICDINETLHKRWRRYDVSKSVQPDIIYLDEIKDRVIIEYASHKAGLNSDKSYD